MVVLDLNGKWRMRRLGKMGSPLEGNGEWLGATVPGTVLSNLLQEEEIEDPFYRDEEIEVKKWTEYDYQFEREFHVSQNLFACERIFLSAKGLDTLAEIRLNDVLMTLTDNMHRSYELDCSDLREGRNKITITFFSPTEHVKKLERKFPDVWNTTNGVMPGISQIRKAHFMFGWDWGPQLPDMGVWRDISIVGYECGRVQDVKFSQEHTDRGVNLSVKSEIASFPKTSGGVGEYKGENSRVESGEFRGETDGDDSRAGSGGVNGVIGGEERGETARETPEVRSGENTINSVSYHDTLFAEVIIEGPINTTMSDLGIKTVLNKEIEITQTESEYETTFFIKNPQLWWPNGYGKQPLYQVRVVLKRKRGNGVESVDEKRFQIGLRTIEVKREKDKWGESFAFVVNGVDLFAKGANYIPEDSLLTRVDEEKTERLIQDCVEANFNCFRVWGGGVYPRDHFYDLCDRYGLIVWQDFMFACATYQLTEDFASSVKQEAIDNVKRLRHHASLGLWCGNNEMELAWEDWDFPKPDHLRRDYLKLFQELLPSVLDEHDPDTFYWPASPSSGGSFNNPNDSNSGNVHYWDVWHGKKPFTDYRKFYFRFCSEFGFQSFPALKTIQEFAEPEDHNIFSHVMESHQKNDAGNGLILHYLSQYLKYPHGFEELLYASQVLQAEAIKYGVEHWRRQRGRCMGSIYWQLNDCWPVASWSSIDYYGRWKALHHAAKKFYSPILLSCEEDVVAREMSLTVTNDTREVVTGKVLWKLCESDGKLLASGEVVAEVPALQAKKIVELDFSRELTDMKQVRKTYFQYCLVSEGEKDVGKRNFRGRQDGRQQQGQHEERLGKRQQVFQQQEARRVAQFQQEARRVAQFGGNVISEGTTLFVPPKHFEWVGPSIKTRLEETEEGFVVSLVSSTLAKFVMLDLSDYDCKFDNNYFDLLPGVPRRVGIQKGAIMGSAGSGRLSLSKEQLREQLKIYVNGEKIINLRG
ncbi:MULTISPECIES: beta-mannosidase [Bacillaceae]|uniref:Beta-mannosidase B n=1 Tax=Evansella alkalicola TaxID=745819 RepID=A0ABS6K1B7_9BACI|nr:MULTISPECIES: glycoside hydrolase family 2 protein [Bacillaceae]MBU9723719.1 hypothetical protein [Bacillus alkalicola]